MKTLYGIGKSVRLMPAFALFFALTGTAAAYPTADSVWIGGKILTVDKNFSIVQALAVKDGKILYAGTDEGAKNYTGKKTAVNDLNGAVVLPGLNDSHLHYVGLGTTKIQVNAHWKPKGEILRAVAEAAAKARPGEWVLGRGWNQMVWSPAEFPTRQELDAVAPNTPVALTRTCGHMSWVNTKALELAGVTRDTKDPVGGEFLRDASGMPTGVMTDQAQDSINSIIPAFTDEQYKDAALAAQSELFRLGITSASDAGSNEETIDRFRELYENGKLKIRLNVMACVTGSPTPEELISGARKFFAKGPRTGLYGDRLQIRSYKIFLDGSLGARSAWMLEDYSDRPGHRGNGKLTDEELYTLVSAGHKAGFQISSHAIGDAANRQVLDAYERVLKEKPNPNHRFRVEHAQILTADDLARFARLGVLPAMQTVHATSDKNMAEDRVGPERVKFAYAWRKLLNSGVIIPNGTDAPVDIVDPWNNFYAAVSRMDENLDPVGGWYPEERMTREEALRSYTNWPAFASFEENKKGSLEPGKLADFIVIDRDVMTCPVTQLRGVSVLRTVVGGETVYEAAR